jgi:histidinol phosphatase-like PHP family hydrolase
MKELKRNRREILRLVNKALDYQFESYSFAHMIDDIMDLSDEEKKWAKENLTYKAYVFRPRK